MNNCKKSIDQFINGEIKDWEGLQPGCSEAEIKSLYLFNVGEGVMYLGNSKEKYTFKVLNYHGFEQGINFCFRDEELIIMFAEFPPLNAVQFNKIFQDTEKRAFRADFYWRDEIIGNGEWVYPDKGITLCIIPETGRLVKIMVYAACSSEDYIQKYHSTQLAREF